MCRHQSHLTQILFSLWNCVTSQTAFSWKPQREKQKLCCHRENLYIFLLFLCLKVTSKLPGVGQKLWTQNRFYDGSKLSINYCGQFCLQMFLFLMNLYGILFYLWAISVFKWGITSCKKNFVGRYFSLTNFLYWTIFHPLFSLFLSLFLPLSILSLSLSSSLYPFSLSFLHLSFSL